MSSQKFLKVTERIGKEESATRLNVDLEAKSKVASHKVLFQRQTLHKSIV